MDETMSKGEVIIVARSCEGSKNFYVSMDVFRQVTEGERCRVVLEEVLPGQLVFLILFPVSKRSGKRNIRRTIEENVGASMQGIRPAGLAVCREFWMKPFAVFARGGMVCSSAGHAAHGFDIIAGHVEEEATTGFVDNVWFEEPTLTSYGHPSAAFVRLGICEDAPVARHIPFELVEEVRAEDADRNGRTHGGAAFGEAVGSFVTSDTLVRGTVCERYGGRCGG